MTTDVEIWARERLLEALESHHRGQSESPYVKKWGTSSTGAVEENESMTFVVSTDAMDRHGDTIAVEGWRFEAYMNNPVILWAHNYARPAIGRAVAVWKEPHSLLARVEFAPTDFAQEIKSLYRAGYQRGVSVGFRPMRYTLRRDKHSGEFLGIDFLEQELLEISAAPVPANPHALRKAHTDTPIMQAYFQQSLPSSLIHDAQGAPSFGEWDEAAFQEVLATLRSARR